MLDDKCALGITKAINGIKIENSLQYDESSFDAASVKRKKSCLLFVGLFGS